MSNSHWNRIHVGSKQSLLILTLESHQMMMISLMELRLPCGDPIGATLMHRP